MHMYVPASAGLGLDAPAPAPRRALEEEQTPPAPATQRRRGDTEPRGARRCRPPFPPSRSPTRLHLPKLAEPPGRIQKSDAQMLSANLKCAFLLSFRESKLSFTKTS